MNQVERTVSLCNALCEEHGTRNPFDLANALGIRVVACPDFKELEGMYKVILGIPYVFLKGSLSRRRAGEILAHELGHHLLHREMGEDNIVQDTFLVDMTLKPEFEANLFAAELLVSEKRMLSLLKEGKTAEEAASLMKRSLPLVELKIKIMKETGKFPS